jgi:hypothetical protein
MTKTRVRPNRNDPARDIAKRDAVDLLDRAVDEFRSHQGAAAVATIFDAGARRELPLKWAQALRSVGRQIRRSLTLEQNAVAAMKAASFERALKLVRKAEEIVAASAKGNLVADYGRRGALEYSGQLCDAAKEMLGDTKRTILNTYGKSCGLDSSLWGSLPSPR